MSAPPRTGWKGGPLALFALLLGAWIGGRVMFWEDPHLHAIEAPAKAAPLAEREETDRVPAFLAGMLFAPQGWQQAARPAATDDAARASVLPPTRPSTAAGRRVGVLTSNGQRAAEPLFDLARPGLGAPLAAAAPDDPVRPGLPPAPPTPRASRFSIDAWGFYRQGSDAAPISQGRVPIYGASQFGAIAQFRVAPQSSLDPRLYLRAYQALVEGGESELALGGSVRPLRAIPVRAYAEMRYLQTPFATDWRPAAYLVTEVPPQHLPGRLQLEVYGQAGWVGGAFATAFADGQASVVREVSRIDLPGGVPLRLSAGAGVWGGAQKGAERVDAGPTLRLDWTMGRIPARLSLDWREQVAGDAAPESGVAATLSTSF